MSKPQYQQLGQLPAERVTPGSMFKNVGVDYAGPFHISMDLSENLLSSKLMFMYLYAIQL